MVRLEELGKLKNVSDHMKVRAGDLPACGIAPQVTTLSRVPTVYIYAKLYYIIYACIYSQAHATMRYMQPILQCTAEDYPTEIRSTEREAGHSPIDSSKGKKA
jgi:hypothetical protein